MVFLKAIYLPVPITGKRSLELLWVKTTFTWHPKDDTFPKYKAWETEASMYVSIDGILNQLGVRHSALEGHIVSTARGLLVFSSCAIQYLAHTAVDGQSPIDPITLDDLVESFSFGEIKKRNLKTECCIVLC